MKSIFRALLVCLLTICSFHLFGQVKDYSSFEVESRQVVWSRVFEEPGVTASELEKKVTSQIIQNSTFKNVVSADRTITATLENYSVDYKKFGVSAFTVSTLISSGKWFGSLKIDFKDGRYRVLLYQLNYYVYHDEPLYAKRSPLVAKQSGTLSEHVLNRHHEIKKSQTDLLDLLHISFLDTFRMQAMDASLPASAHSRDW